MKKATREQTKQHNYRLVLKLIYDNEKISRAEIARITALTPTTVSALVDEWIAQGLVSEVGQSRLTVGKPPTHLSLVKDARQMIGIDLGNSELRGVVTNLRGEIIHQSCLRLEGRKGSQALELVFQLVENMLKMVDRPLLGIGIGTPGIVEKDARIIRGSINLDWWDLPLCDLLEERFHQPVLMINDSRAAVLGEYTFGKSRGISDLVVIKVGDGISAGILLGGELYYGFSSGAGEIGHVTVAPEGDMCRCGHRGCLEAMASCGSIIRQAQRLAQSHPESLLSRLKTHPADIEFEDVLQAVKEGDELATRLVEQVGEYLGVAAANIVGLLNIPRIVIAGIVSKFGEPLTQSIRQKMSQYSISAIADQTEIEISPLGDDIVTLGAVALLVRNKLGLL